MKIATLLVVLGSCSGEERPVSSVVHRARPSDLGPPDRIVTLEELAGPRRSTPGTLVTGRVDPARGIRERAHGVTVTSEDGFDALVDDDNGRELVARAYDSERFAYGGDGFTGDTHIERVISIVARTDRYVSVFLGHSMYTPGAAHANNDLTCVTFDRATGARATLGDLPLKPDAAWRRDATAFVLDPLDPARAMLCTSSNDGVVELHAVRLGK